MKCLLTGITGFLGSHLADLLTAEGHEVVGMARSVPSRALSEGVGKARLHPVDLTDRAGVARVLESEQPDVIIHAAAQASVPRSFEAPEATWAVNLEGTRILYDSVRSLGLRVQSIVYISTASVYRSAATAIPLDEDAPLAPASPYAASKAAADLLSFQYAVNYDLPIVRLRPFNQLGPRQRPGFVVSDVASQIARAEAGLQPPEIHVGDLRAVRDFTDVRDMARAVWDVARYGTAAAVYNAGTGQGRRIEDVVHALLKLSRISVRLVVDRARLRKGDPSCLVADSSLLQRTTGWRPVIPFEKSLEDVLEDWRSRVRSG